MSEATTFRVAVVWTGDDGLLKFAPVREEGRMEGESDEGHYARASAELVYRGYLRPDQPWAVVPLSEFPGGQRHNRYFRNCWKLIGGKVAVDLASARAQVLAEIREERNRRLDASDREKSRLDDVGTPQQRAALARYRQQLRDLPLQVQADLAVWLASAEELEHYQPPWPTPPS